MAAVNRPTNTAVKDRDVNNKLQLYGIYQAFANGKVPSNKQIDIAINSALASKPLSSPSPKLSEEGRQLVADLTEVIRQAKYLLLTKNEGNVLQEFIWDTLHLDGGGAKLPTGPADRATVQQHGKEALNGLKTLGTLILSNGQFRKLLEDATILVRDIAGDAAQNAASKVGPSQEQLDQIDEPAEDNIWHDVSDLSLENLRKQARATYETYKPFSKEEVQMAAQQGIGTAQPQDGQDVTRVNASQAADNLQSQVRSNIPDQRQEDVKKVTGGFAEHAKNYYGEKMPKERRDRTIWRLKKMVTEIQAHSDYQQAIDTLLSLAETYGGHARNVRSQATGTVKDVHGDGSLQRAEANLKILIERFANSTSTDDFFEALNNIYRDADRDPELKDWFKSVDGYIRRCLQEQGYILHDDAKGEWNRLYDKGQFLLRERYKDHTDHLVDEIKFLADQFDTDSQNKACGEAVRKLFWDLGNHDHDQPKFKKRLLKDVTEVIIPGILENTRYIPIPRIEISDPQIDAVVENLVIESDNLFPNVVEFGNDNYFRLGRRQIKSQSENKVMIAASGIQMDLRDVAYYVKKKHGFPSMTDKGVLDIILAGEGFSFKIAARNAHESDRTHFLTVDKVDVTIRNLAIKVKQSNHKLLFRIAKPLLLKMMRPVIQKTLEKEVKDSFEKADAFLYSVHQEVQRGAQAAKEDPESAPSIYQRYVNAFQAKMMEKTEKGKEEKTTTINVAVTKQDSMFKNVSLPGGISTKATEFKELAAKGDRWESPVFSIGSAKESSDIPRLAPVTRKPHTTTPGTVRGSNHSSGNGHVSNPFTPSDSTAYNSTQAEANSNHIAATAATPAVVSSHSWFQRPGQPDI